MRWFAPIRGLFREPATRWGRTFLLAGVVGVLAGLASAGLELLLHEGVLGIIGRVASPSGGFVLPSFDWRILLLPAVGGLIGGIIVTALRGQPEHGTNHMIAAFHRDGGRLALPGPTLKALAAVGMIVCGGSAGPEGPIAALGAAIGSTVGRRLNLSPRLVRNLLIAGCAGGVGAIFRCPLGGALFAASVLYREEDFESDSIVPGLVSSVVAYSTFMAFRGYGHHLLEGSHRLVFSSPFELLAYALLGPICGLLSIFLSLCVGTVHGVTARSRLPQWTTAMMGGLAVGVIACVLPQVMDAQYQFLQQFMDGSPGDNNSFIFTSPSGIAVMRSWWSWAAILGSIAVFKCVASALTVGTAGAGGLLGPSVFIGGVAGAFVAALLEAVYPGNFPDTLRQGLLAVGMGGVLAAAMRTPMAAIVMVTEMTGSYGLIVPLMLVCTTSYVIGRRWGLNDAQVRTLSESPAHAGDPIIHMLESFRVRDVAHTDWPYVISPTTTLSEMVALIRSGTHPLFIVVDAERLIGIVSISDIRRLSDPGIGDLVIAADLMTADIEVAYATQGLYEVLDTFRRTGHEGLPVVSREGARRYVGVLTRQAIHEALRTRSVQLGEQLRREDTALAAIEQDEQLYQLVLGIPTQREDTVLRRPVPPEVVGQSLRQADFRRRFGSQVIAIQGDDGRLQCPPDIDTPLSAADILLVISAGHSEPSHITESTAD